MGKKRLTLFKDDPAPASAAPSTIRLRAPAGNFALAATEAEVRIDGARIAGGNGRFEFDLAQETWLDIVIIRA